MIKKILLLTLYIAIYISFQYIDVAMSDTYRLVPHNVLTLIDNYYLFCSVVLHVFVL